MAYVTERIRPGLVFAAHAFGRLSKGFIRTYRKGIYDNLLITKPAFDPVSHAHGYENTFVTIEIGLFLSASLHGLHVPFLSLSDNTLVFTVDRKLFTHYMPATTTSS